jgi:hypothetical protein
MRDIIASILTDTSMRDESAVEAAFMQQAVASPWANLD